MAGERSGNHEADGLLAGLVRKPGDTGAVRLSGRCGDCGYLLGSPGHQVACTPAWAGRDDQDTLRDLLDGLKGL